MKNFVFPSGEQAWPDEVGQPDALLDDNAGLLRNPPAAAQIAGAGSAVMRLRRQGERDEYLEALRAVFAPAYRFEHLDGERWPAAALAHLCADALQAGIEPDYVAELIRQRDLLPESPDVLHWPWPIRVYTLGRFALAKDGRPLSFNGKSPHKPLELLKALIALGGREVHTSAVMRALWPPTTSRDLRKLFDNTLHRLRGILGRADAVLLRDSKLTLDLRRCWVDAWAFDRIAGRICRGEAVAPQLAEAGWRLYQGHFLQREDEVPWLLPYRDRLRSRFHRFVLADGGRLETAGHWEAAAQVYEHAIEVDNLSEALYRRLMVCRQKCGESAEALRVYRRCRELLSVVLGVKPSAETEAIHRQIDGA